MNNRLDHDRLQLFIRFQHAGYEVIASEHIVMHIIGQAHIIIMYSFIVQDANITHSQHETQGNYARTQLLPPTLLIFTDILAFLYIRKQVIK